MNDYRVYAQKSTCARTDSVFSADVPLAMAYVKDQSWETPMCAADALNHGTAFRRLVKPFLGAEVCDEQ